MGWLPDFFKRTAIEAMGEAPELCILSQIELSQAGFRTNSYNGGDAGDGLSF